jgi:hypothetical protein
MNLYLSALIIFLFTFSQAHGQYEIQEWEKKSIDKDSTLISISRYDSLNRIVQEKILDHQDPNQNYMKQYEFRSNLLLNEKWSTASEGIYLIYTYHYDKKNRLKSVEENYNNKVLVKYKSYLYNSNGQMVKEITFADKRLTDVETTFYYANNLLVKEEVRFGSVYGNDRDRSVWIETLYSYKPDTILNSIQTTFRGDKNSLITVSNYFYNSNGEKVKIEEFENKDGKSILKSTYYYTKVFNN